MNAAKAKHPESYEDFKIGDRVFCLAWIGMPFEVVGKDNQQQRIFLTGRGPCSLPEGAMIDIDRTSMFMLTHNLWDQIWYWPDRAGETYKQVVERFIGQHKEGDIVAGYVLSPPLLESFHFANTHPEAGMAFRLSFGALGGHHQIHAQPVAAVDHESKQVVVHYDPSLPEDLWIRTGPAMPLRIELHSYRWALVYGRMLINYGDFAAQP